MGVPDLQKSWELFSALVIEEIDKRSDMALDQIMGGVR
jgi:hypothetical protein